MAECHVKAYTLIHKQREEMGFIDTKVSYAHHMRVFAPKNPKSTWHRFCTPIMERLFQSSISKTYLTGKRCFPLRAIKDAGCGLFCDFHAINYYSRTAVSGFESGFMDGVPVNDLGWEIYPEGIVKSALDLYALAPLPIYITENGTCDTKDVFRSRYIYEHIKALCESGLPVQRYYHWCFADNFEWVEGYTARFGIVHVDFKTQQRTIKRSGEFFTKMIEAKGVTQEMYNEYCDTAYNISKTR
jgi:beta-glucosidase